MRETQSRERTYDLGQRTSYRLIALMELADLRSVDAEVAALALLAEELRQPAQLLGAAGLSGGLPGVPVQRGGLPGISNPGP